MSAQKPVSGRTLRKRKSQTLDICRRHIALWASRAWIYQVVAINIQVYIVQCTYCFLYTPIQRSLKAITYEISARECKVSDDILNQQNFPRAHTEEKGLETPWYPYSNLAFGGGRGQQMNGTGNSCTKGFQTK
jgi:hypothetical protein